LALQFSAVVVAATVVVAPAVVAATVVASELTVVGLAVVGAEVDAEEQAPLTQDSPVAQAPVYSLQEDPSEPPVDPY